MLPWCDIATLSPKTLDWPIASFQVTKAVIVPWFFHHHLLYMINHEVECPNGVSTPYPPDHVISLLESSVRQPSNIEFPPSSTPFPSQLLHLLSFCIHLDTLPTCKFTPCHISCTHPQLEEYPLPGPPTTQFLYPWPQSAQNDEMQLAPVRGMMDTSVIRLLNSFYGRQ